MRDPAREDELKRFVDGLRNAFAKALPTLKVAGEQLKMSVENLKRSMEAFTKELNESMEQWDKDDDEDGHGEGARV